MQLADLVPSLAIGHALKRAGFPQDTALVYYRSGGDRSNPAQVGLRDRVLPFEVVCAAPTAEEIFVYANPRDTAWARERYAGGKAEWVIYGNGPDVCDTKLAEAAARAWLAWKGKK